MKFLAMDIIDHFYPENDRLRKTLLQHSSQVKNKALEILQNAHHLNHTFNMDLVENGALLHDIGIKFCKAPDIFCVGDSPYIQHGILGAKALRALSMNLEPYARICERHTGVGITAQEIMEQHLPLPCIDLLPETFEEKLICLADKFFSKSGDMKEKPFSKIQHSIAKFGTDSSIRFQELCKLFELSL